MLQLLGAVEEEALFRLIDLVVDHDTAGALAFIEELSEQGQDLGRLVTDLLEHLRHLMLVQHMGEVPGSLPVTEETRDRLRAQANQLGEPTTIRLIDLLAVAVDDMRQGGDPRLPLELALVKVTRPAADLSREAVAYRLEQLESRAQHGHVAADPSGAVPETRPEEPRPSEPGAGARAAEPRRRARAAPGGLAAHDPAGRREGRDPGRVAPARGAPVRARGRHAHARVPAGRRFHRKLAEQPKNATVLRDTLYEVTGRKLAVAFEVGDAPDADDDEEPDGPVSEEEIIQLMKDKFDAEEIEPQ